MARGGRWLGGGRSHLAPPERSHGHRRRSWNLLQVLFALFAHGHRRRKPSAPGVFWTVLLMEQVAEATCILCKKLQRTRTWRFPRVSRAKSGILWLSGGTTRVRWCGACYLGPSMALEHLIGSIPHGTGPLCVSLFFVLFTNLVIEKKSFLWRRCALVYELSRWFTALLLRIHIHRIIESHSSSKVG